MEGILDQAVIGQSDLSTILRAGSCELKAWAGSETTRLNYLLLSYRSHASHVADSFLACGHGDVIGLECSLRCPLHG